MARLPRKRIPEGLLGDVCAPLGIPEPSIGGTIITVERKSPNLRIRSIETQPGVRREKTPLCCGYKVRHSEINRQREIAQKALGPKFDPKAFNDTVVLGGNVPLDVLAKNVEEYIRRG